MYGHQEAALRAISRRQSTLVSTGTERMLVDFGRASLLGKARQQPDKVRMVVDKVRNLKGNHGLNAQNGEYTDLVKLGVIDAAKVTRSALQNAGSIAALFLTTEVVISDLPEEHGHSHGGGMPDMDF